VRPRARILIADAVDEKARTVFTGEGFEVSYLPGITPGELLPAVAGCDALIVRSRTKVTAGVLAAGKELRVVGRAGAGVDNIDVEEATRRGIVVMNTPGGNTVSTAEHTISMMLALARNIPAADRSMRAGEWKRGEFVGTEVSGKTLGLIGLGRVGLEVARRAAALGMKVLAYDPLVADDAARKLGAEPAGLPDLFRRADFISVHTPLTPETRDLIRLDTLRSCRRGVRIINCARGGIVNEPDLLAALDEGIVAGAALDVFEQEPPADARLLGHPRIVLTPHLGASTEEAQEKVAIQVARQVADFLLRRDATGAVNADVIRVGMRPELRPYLVLAERMGLLVSQLVSGPVGGVRTVLRGAVPEDAGDAVLASFLKGFLAPMLNGPVNDVNAIVLARDRGLALLTAHEAGAGRYPSELYTECATGAGTRSVSGTVFGIQDVRITGLDGYHFEAKPEGHMLVYRNTDRPGMLARVSAILADRSINIADLSLGRLKAGETALTVIATDQPVPADALREIAQIKGVSDIHTLEL
jgi:D-3-phosphoglycerate dehydrogenase